MKNEKKGLGGSLGKVWSQYSFIFVLFIIMIGYAFTITSNGNAFKWSHIAAILSSQNTVIVGTIALGMAFVIITGQIDLSVGSQLVLCTGVTIIVFNTTNSIFLMALAAILTGAACGAVNGLLVGFGKMPPFVVTLGTMLIYRSLTLSVVRKIDPAISGSSSSQFAMLSDNSKYEISKKTKYGKTIYAVGSNEKSARLAGINVTWVKISVFILTGICVGVASMLQACKIGNVTPASSGVSYEMYAIASVVLAGVSMAGGKGNMVGVIFGALSYTTINFIIVSIPGLSVDIQDTFQGLVLIVVILVQTVGPVMKENLQRAKMRQLAEKA